ncbi:hypothetical protein BLNAU_4384 [Blattamonas nauphoetae]|uniref:Mediator complex subunit 5 n=1 Tax=Blattamonas nauphoetae TaxID=2049346 RepID=A0ABQ9YAJ4_9EUKA|nr:hypothetical protein BLNAU_4384 [Blattamonas nauphoetae]
MSNSPENTLDISQDSVQVPLFLTTPTARFKSFEEASPFFVSLVKYVKEGHSLNTEALRKAQDVLTHLIGLLQDIRDVRPLIGKLVPPPNNNADGFTKAILTLVTTGHHSIGQTEHDLDDISRSSNLSTESVRQIVLEHVLQPVGPYISYCCQNRLIIQDDSIQQSLLTDVLIFFLKLASFTITRSLLSFESNYSTLLCQEKLLYHVQQHQHADLLVRTRGKADLRRLNEEGLADELETFGFWVDFTSSDIKQIRKDNTSLMASLIGAVNLEGSLFGFNSLFACLIESLHFLDCSIHTSDIDMQWCVHQKRGHMMDQNLQCNDEVIGHINYLKAMFAHLPPPEQVQVSNNVMITCAIQKLSFPSTMTDFYVSQSDPTVDQLIGGLPNVFAETLPPIFMKSFPGDVVMERAVRASFTDPNLLTFKLSAVALDSFIPEPHFETIYPLLLRGFHVSLISFDETHRGLKTDARLGVFIAYLLFTKERGRITLEIFKTHQPAKMSGFVDTAIFFVITTSKHKFA